MKLSGVVLDSSDASALAGFYRLLLGWEVEQDEPGWVKLKTPNGRPGPSFQTEETYVQPRVRRSGDQQMTLHLNIEVDDLNALAPGAVAVGAGPRVFSSRLADQLLRRAPGVDRCAEVPVRERSPFGVDFGATS